ncbi:hypothetical protein FD13_GL001047 [Levilactobacillus senmaizukei DSM 21775 = NBRC 103853]|uniref:Phage gp6-like head-tail connector protein n=1 Tax=Levilactobacillus senmaizukei DSM 21775 = NBRC 103853 TaxID=1423803 RepID=A0A0R2DNJ6_9LACO|nr:head-tail connector protein [Levilactobacillus senmaizukei]KRN01453.1 hypothetical protein FD13_GL001047 [Levilactobacillus senmaizukei DSM 21775 = NBRC 103853]
MEHDALFEEFKTHIEWEDSMDDSMLDRYLEMARQYVRNATGNETDQLVLMVAAILNDYRVPEKEMATALDSLTPFFIQEVYSNDTVNQSSEA